MKILSLLLSLCITLNTFAATGGLTELERQIDEYQYVMTVEWDQKDQIFYDKETDEFLKKLGETIQKEGLTKEQIGQIAEKKIQNTRTLEALKLKLSLLSSKPSESELAETLRETSKEFYHRGASWSGSKAEIAGTVLAVLLVGYIIWWNSTHECEGYVTETECGWYDVCSSYGYDYETGSRYCMSYSSQYGCFDNTRCTGYVKK